VLGILTVNIGAAARDRAARLLEWLRTRPEDVIVLTETSAGPGTALLVDAYTRAGYQVIVPGTLDGERGVAILSRVPVTNKPTITAGVSLPGRTLATGLGTDPPVSVIGIYVPSRDRSAVKTARKERFLGCVLAALDTLPPQDRAWTVLGGDYNVIARTHRPMHRGFFDFEFQFMEELNRYGFHDVFDRRYPGEQEYSWIGRTGDGYRYDYFHVGSAVAERITGCTYLHETRENQLTDHAALTLCLDIDVHRRLDISTPGLPVEAPDSTLF
jgi:exodeoxyribonuclease III